MTKFIDLQEAFEIELNVLDDNINKPKSMDTEWWLNRGLEKFWKTRYSGTNAKGTSFEQSQKRIDDLRTLVTTVVYSNEIVKNNTTYHINLPENYAIMVGDSVNISPNEILQNNCWPLDDNGDPIEKTTDTIEATIENIDRQLNNSLSEHKLKYCSARPLKLIQGNEVILYTDGQYDIKQYKLTYLRYPKKIDIHTNPFGEYTDMPEHTHSEIVKIAAQMYIENKGNQRLNTHNVETQEME